MDPNLTRLLRLTSTYLPLAGTVVVLLIATFDSSVLNEISTSLLLAIMAVSFVFVAVHLDQRLSALQTSVQSLNTDLAARVVTLEATQRSYLEATVPDIRTGTLADAFDRALRGRGRIGHLRVYAISSAQIYSFVSNSNLIVDRCSLLIQGFPPEYESDFAHEVRLVARNWHKLVDARRIKDLEILSYDYFPTDYEVMFDTDVLILGLFDYDADDYSKVALRAATLIEGASPAAQTLITEFRDRFDGLFEACRTAHGPNVYYKT
jgi:hypothetical protein